MIGYLSTGAPAWVAGMNARSLVGPRGLTLAELWMADSDPVGFWTLGDATTPPQDVSGNGRHVASDSCTVTLGATGLVSGTTCGEFDASHSCFVTYGAWMDSGEITVEGLFRADDLSGYHALVMRDGAGRRYQWRTNGLRLECIPFVGGSPRTLTGATDLSTGTTYHLAFTHDGQRSRLYINGVEDAEHSSDQGALDTGTSDLYFGGQQGIYWDGRMSHVAYHTTALSESVLAAHTEAAGL